MPIGLPRRWFQFNLRTLLAASLVVSLVCYWTAERWKKPIVSTSRLRFHSHPENGTLPLMAAYSVKLPNSSVIFIDYFPYGSPDECLVTYPNKSEIKLGGSGLRRDHPEWGPYPPMPPEFEARFFALRKLLDSRMPENMRLHFQKSDPKAPPFNAPQEFGRASIVIGLNKNVLEAPDPDVDYEFWTIPPDQWTSPSP